MTNIKIPESENIRVYKTFANEMRAFQRGFFEKHESKISQQAAVKKMFEEVKNKT